MSAAPVGAQAGGCALRGYRDDCFARWTRSTLSMRSATISIAGIDTRFYVRRARYAPRDQTCSARLAQPWQSAGTLAAT
jgi:hypothetical protein